MDIKSGNQQTEHIVIDPFGIQNKNELYAVLSMAISMLIVIDAQTIYSSSK